MLLLLGLYSHPDMLAHASANCSHLDLFDELTEPGFKILWEVMSEAQTQYGKHPTPFMVSNDVTLKFEGLTEAMSMRALPQIQLILPLITDDPPIEDRERVRERLEKALQKAIGIQAAEERWTVMDVEEQAAKLAGMANLLRNVAPAASVRKRPLAAEIRSSILRVTPRYSWGLPHWDASGSDWYIKEIHGLLGPSGGGKTVNACTIAEAQCRAGRNVALALYEQALEEDVAQRLYSNLSNVSMKHLRGMEYENIEPAIKAKMDRAGDKYNNQLIVLDMVGENAGNGGPQELFQHLQEERRETGFWPDLVIVDWLGEMALRYENARATPDGSLRYAMESIMSELNQFKETPGNETTFLVLHQTSTNAQAAGPNFRPKRTDAHEFRSFGNKLDSCCQLGTMDDNGICFFIAGKVRRGQRHERIIKLNGEYMRFHDVSGEYQENPGGRGFMTHADAGAIATANEGAEGDITTHV